jgi:hypothetical protein
MGVRLSHYCVAPPVAAAAAAPVADGLPTKICNVVDAFVEVWNASSQCICCEFTSSAHACTCWLGAADTFLRLMNISPIPSPVTLLDASSSDAVIVSALVACLAGTFTHATTLLAFGSIPKSITLALTKSATPLDVGSGTIVLLNVVAGAGGVVVDVVDSSVDDDDDDVSSSLLVLAYNIG